MDIAKLRTITASFLLLLPLTVAAQDTPKIEIFGGYSFLHDAEQSYIQLQAASMNGWAVSIKVNVTPRISLVADFSGNYGQRGSDLLLTTSSAAGTRQVGLVPDNLRQHTFLFGPEVRVLRRDRLSVNVRALLGVAHTNTMVLPFREPVERSPGSTAPPFTQAVVLGGNDFAASLGGSVDYRITDRWTYRILQPELLAIRYNEISAGFASATSVNTYSLRLSTGIVFTPAASSFAHDTKSGRRLFSFGVIGGAGLTDAFGHDRTAYFPLPSGGLRSALERSYSPLKDYVIGPTLNIGLPWRGLSVEIDALYRPLNLSMANVLPDGSLNSDSPATVVTWELPVLVKYKPGSGALQPFIEAGPSFRASGNLNNANPSVYGATAGLGVEAAFWKLKMGPVARYTHWSADPETGSPTRRNQVELLFGLAF